MSDPIEFNVSLNEPVNFNLEVGNQGPKGDKGDTGSKGETGDRGEKGDPGTTDYSQLQNKPQLDIYLKKSDADTTTAGLLNKISQNTDSVNDTRNSLRNYALISDVDSRVTDTEARVNNKITQAKTEVEGEVSALDTKLTKQTSDNKADITQLKANLNTTNSVLLTHKEQADKKFDDIKVEQSDQDTLISDILNALSAESEKGTNLKLNTSATKVLGMSIYGNLEQTKYTGKNLLKLPNGYVNNGDVKVSIVDDIIYCQGVSTRITTANLTTPIGYPIIAGTYTFSIKEPISNSIALMVDGKEACLLSKNTRTQAFTLPESGKNFFLQLRTELNKPINLKIEELMIERGNTSTDYEPYTGGYNNLFDEFSELPVRKNGLKLENVNGILKFTGMPTTDWNTMISRDITAALSDKADYTVVQYNTYGHKLYPAIVAYKVDGSGGDEINAINSKTFVFRVDKTKYNRYVMKLQVATRASFSEPVTIYNNYALFQGNYDENNLPEYSPYNTGLATPRPQLPQPINGVSNTTIYVQGKNLFDTRFGNRIIQGVEIKTYDDGSFELNGTPTNGFSLTNVFGSKSYVPSGKYKIKVEIIGGSVQKVEPSATFLCVYTIQLSNTGLNSEYVREADIVAGNIKEFTNTVNIPKSDMYTPYIWIPYHIENKKAFYSYNNLRMRVTLVPNGENTDFVKFEGQQLTIPTGLNLYKLTDNIYDEVKLENGVAKMIKRVGKLELSGEENTISFYRTTLTGMVGFRYEVSGNQFYTQRQLIADITCSHFTSVNEDTTWGGIANKTGVSIYGGYDNIFPKYSNTMGFWFTVPDQFNLGITDVASFKNWLKSEKAKGTPVTVYYEMKIPTEEEITDPTLLSELKKLMEMRTYKGVTNISITGTGLAPEIKAKYMRKIN
nr:MAG TPA: nucleoid-associated protein [Caudoviricetes sp.]